ncbi:MAG TPA: glycine cleavage system aminomethyltransferase GcvT [Hyphomonadaceae bacterium]|jgi:aminomethyltransferase|nr:glycine cleavage system aminomethyltransferase GcvT [Hyphomonadaceae bacterium]
MAEASTAPLKKTPLHALHVRLGGRMVEFGGYDMPVQYPEGIMAEHNWTRAHAGLFDVSHMGPCFLELPTIGGADAHQRIAEIFEPLVCADVRGLKPGEQKLTLLLDENGGILDDLMVARAPDAQGDGALYIVVNAGTKEADFARIAAQAGQRAKLTRMDSNALLALQGPEAGDIMAEIAPATKDMTFMQSGPVMIDGVKCAVTRGGYTGEDGFEILYPAARAVAFAERLLADPRVKPIGLGARDSLRLEAGMCLYGHDIDTTKSPISASLAWTVSKARRERADFPGAQRILGELKDGVASKRVGIRPAGRQPAREGTEIQSVDGASIGVVTSGGFGPTVNGPVAMGYVATSHAKAGTPLKLIVRGKALDAEVAALPFVPHKYKR